MAEATEKPKKILVRAVRTGFYGKGLSGRRYRPGELLYINDESEFSDAHRVPGKTFTAKNNPRRSQGWMEKVTPDQLQREQLASQTAIPSSAPSPAAESTPPAEAGGEKVDPDKGVPGAKAEPPKAPEKPKGGGPKGKK